MNSASLLFVLICLTSFACVNSKGVGGGKGGRRSGHNLSRGGHNLRRGGYSSTNEITSGNTNSLNSATSAWSSRQPFYQTLYNYPDRSILLSKRYGSTFGKHGIGDNTFINHNHYSRPLQDGGSSLLSSALFTNLRMNSKDDKQWRATTKAPYFENKVPGSESVLPAASVIGAAVAFGLASLLPLNVPGHKPLMYCNSTDIAQLPIQLEDKIYSCVDNNIAISCSDCTNKTMECDLKEPNDLLDFYCTNGTLITKFDIVCNSTVILNNSMIESTKTLDCYFGSYRAKLSSFIPTTSTEPSLTSTTEKNFSLESRIHMFLLNLIGKSDVYEPTTESSFVQKTRIQYKDDDLRWIPEALTLPPDYEVPKEEFPFFLVYRVKSKGDGKVEETTQYLVEEPLSKIWLKLHLDFGVVLPDFLEKVPNEYYSSTSKNLDD